MLRVLICVLILTCTLGLKEQSEEISPPHCTQVSKDTDYVSRFKMDYPVVYIIPGQREAYQEMFCLNPPEVNKAVTTVCDWAGPPQVQFTMGDEYMHVVRMDPTGRYLGNAVITTYQFCSHGVYTAIQNETIIPTICELQQS